MMQLQPTIRKFHSVAIIAKPRIENLETVLNPVLDYLSNSGMEISVEENLRRYTGRFQVQTFNSKIPAVIDLVIALGGDGTILRVARCLESYQTVVMAVNMGGLGFMTAFTSSELLSGLKDVIEGRCYVSKRLVLKASHYRNKRCIGNFNVLNEVVINKATLARIIQLETMVDKDLVTTFLSDGLIIATPTGSTAYSLSAGGPIIMPHLEVVTITPICPHTLTNRPIVIAPNKSIKVTLKSQGSEVLVTLDGQIGSPVKYLDTIIVCRNEDDFLLVENPRMHFYKVLQHKLKWGQR